MANEIERISITLEDRDNINVNLENKDSIKVNLSEKPNAGLKMGVAKAVRVDNHDKSHVHTQLTPSSNWNIQHNLAKYPSVSIVNSAGDIVFGDVTYEDEENISISFSAAFAGKAYLN